MRKKDLTPTAARTLWALAILAGAASCGPSSPPISTGSAPPAVVPQPRLQTRSQPPQESSQPDAEPRIARSLAAPEAGPAIEAGSVQAPGAAGASRASSKDAPDRRGRFRVVRRPASNPRNIKMRDSGFLEEVVSDMAKTIDPKLTVDVPVSFVELGEANAFYSPKDHTISIGYELLDQMILMFIKNADRDDPKVAAKVAQQVVDTLSFVFYHEAAHAIIDLDDLPITGREEDDADQLATVMTVASARSKAPAEIKPNGLTHRAQGGAAAINGAIFFLLSSGGEGQDVSDLPFWDEHSLSQQRFYNILTWVYGSDPQKYAYLVEQKVLPESRAARARGEFARMVKAWLRILEGARAA